MTLELSADEVAVGDDERLLAPEVLLSLESAKGPVRRVEEPSQGGESAHPGRAILVQAVPQGRGIEAACGILHIDPGDLVEGQRDIVPPGGQPLRDRLAESPRSARPPALRQRDRVTLQVRREGGGVPLMGVQMDLVPIVTKTTDEIHDVLFTPASRRDHR